MTAFIASISALAAPPSQYVNKERRFSFTLPKGWENLKDQPPVIAFVGQREYEFQANFNVYSEPVKISDLARYVRLSKANIAKAKTLKILNEKKTKLGSEPAYQMHLALTIPGKPPMKNRMIVCLHHKRGFIFTYTALTVNYAKFDADFDKALSTFQWND